MAEKIRLKPWLEPAPLDKDSALLLSETTSYSLKGKALAAIVPLLDGTRSEDDIADALSDSFDLPELFYHLIQLKKKGLIEAIHEEEPSPGEVFYDRLGGNTAKGNSPQHIKVTAIGAVSPQPIADSLSRLDPFQVELGEWHSDPLDRESLWIVVTANYLDPDLAKFNSKALDTGTVWMPFKPNGIEPWVGPLFHPGKTACLECLLHRLRGHRLLEMRLAHEKGRLPCLSQGLSTASLDTACGLLGLELEKIFFESPHAFIQKGVLTINLKSLETFRHELVQRPHCPACGEISDGVLTGLPDRVFRLSKQPKAMYRDGGERIKAATETMKLFKTRISPITGEVGGLDTNEKVPLFFGHSVTSSWAALNGNRAGLSKARLGAVGTSAGKGRSEVQAKTSALGEALERYCSQHFGYEPCFRAPYSDIHEKAVHPLKLNPFTMSQFENREEWAKRADTGRVPEVFDENAPIDWTPVWSLTRNKWKWVPSAFTYYHYPKEGGGKYCHGDSNGVAAGNCIEEAIMQGFFELVERDGVALWWYNMVQRPVLDLNTFGSSFANEAAEGMGRHNYTLHVLDLTTDLGIPVFAAVGLHGSDPDAEPLLGFGCHFDAQIALDRAISEVGQSWGLVENMSPNEISRKVTDHNLSTELFLRSPDDAPLTPFSAFINHATDDFLKDVETCVSILENLGLEMLAADLTRPEVGLSVVRVIVPGMVHFWPRLAAERLYEVPVRLGWMEEPKTEEELNPVPFYF
ncbi:TOMM precursor leader peptide-binding protein [Thermodesulfobacteriota bacterium]